MKSATISEAEQRQIDIWEAEKELARREFIEFVKYTKSDYSVQWFHVLLCKYLQDFAEGKIKKLMVFMPPQHGKSQLVSRHLPAYLLGFNPKNKIAVCSYSDDLSCGFNRDCQTIIQEQSYKDLFPNTQLNNKNVATDARAGVLKNSSIFETVKHKGCFMSVGVGLPLTGKTVDIGIIDDPVKDAVDADSVTMRQKNWEWYDQVFSTRLHNNSQVLFTMTRWHEDDLAGRILKSKDAENWVILKLPAIKTKVAHHIEDKRQEGEALWEAKHSAARILMRSERAFEAMYQQNPLPTKGGLVFPEVVIIDKMPDHLEKRAIGLDFGYSNDPTAAVECGINRAKKELYLDQLIYETGLVNSEIAGLLKDKKNLPLWCETEPKSLEELRRAGLRMVKRADKGKGSILAGIQILHEYKIFITKRSFGGINEQSKYTYKTDGYGLPTNDPIEEFNHFWDAVRYYAIMELTSHERKAIAISKPRK